MLKECLSVFQQCWLSITVTERAELFGIDDDGCLMSYHVLLLVTTMCSNGVCRFSSNAGYQTDTFGLLLGSF